MSPIVASVGSSASTLKPRMSQRIKGIKIHLAVDKYGFP
jgi:hypothetical protein